jgi:hypothetical protein
MDDSRNIKHLLNISRPDQQKQYRTDVSLAEYLSTLLEMPAKRQKRRWESPCLQNIPTTSQRTLGLRAFLKPLSQLHFPA